MARSKEWTAEDREAALGWIARKSKTGAIFVGQDETADDMLPALADITGLEDFSEAAQAALTTSAWKRLLGALRQRKHQADDDDQDQGPQQAQQQACHSCVQLRSEVESLQARLSDATGHVALAKTQIDRLQKAAAEDSDYMLDMQGHIDRLEEFLGDHGLLDEDGELIEEDVEPDNVIVTQSPPDPPTCRCQQA